MVIGVNHSLKAIETPRSPATFLEGVYQQLFGKACTSFDPTLSLTEKRWEVGGKFGIKPTTFDALLSIAKEENLTRRRDQITRLEKRLDETELKQIKKFSKSFNKGELTKDEMERLKEAGTDLAKLRKTRQKAEEIALSPIYFDCNPYELTTLFETRLIYNIVGFQKTIEDGANEHAIRIEGRHLAIRKGDEWVTLPELLEVLVFDKVEGAFASKNNPDERWNYFGISGLQPIDRFYHHERAALETYPQDNSRLHPVAKLSKVQMNALQEVAIKFDPKDPSLKDKNAVIQFFTHPRPLFKSKFLRNLDSQVPIHCGIRVIYEDGTVFSTGFGSTLAEDKYNDTLNKYLGTINGQPTNLDYEEFRIHEGRVTTSVPITQEKAEKIISNLSEMRKKSIRFNILKQNCMRLGTYVLGQADVNLNIEIPIPTFLGRLLPDAPLLLKQISEKIHLLAIRIIPQVLLSLGRRIQTFFINSLVYCLGGTIASPIRKEESEWVDGQEDLDTFDRLINSPLDKEAEKIVHSSLFLHWQLEQKSTFVAPYEGSPSMSILPSDSPVRRAEGKRLHTFYRRMYEKCVLDNRAA